MKTDVLFHYCRWNEIKSVISRLKEKRDIDLTYDEGCYFRCAIQHNNTEILNVLLDYYRETQLDNCSFDERMDRKEKLQEILQSAVDQIYYNISDEIMAILKPHLDYDKDQDLEGFEDQIAGSLGFSDDSVDLSGQEGNGSDYSDRDND